MNARRFPPGPKSYLFGFDLIGEIKRDPLTFYDQQRRQYGDVVYMKLGPFHDYTLFHPDAIHELLTSKAKSFARMDRQMEVFRQWNGNSVVTTDGADWLRHRRVLQPAFSPKRLAGYGQEIALIAEASFDRAISDRVESIDFEQAMIDLTTAIICKTMFGADLGPRLEEVREAVRLISRTTYEEMMKPFSLPGWLPLPSMRRKREAIATLDSVVRQFIRQRREGGKDTGDLLSMLLFAVAEEVGAKGLTDEEVRDNCMTIFMAGHDTTAAGLTWLGWFLASRPHFAAKAREEVQAVVGPRRPTFADLEKLTFLEQVVNETLRHRPAAIAVFARKAIEEVELGGYVLPKNALVHALSYSVHHDERWFPQPDEFNPDRFSPERVDQIRENAYFPFGMGPRACIGGHFAKMEMMLVAAVLLQKYQFSPAAGQVEPEPLSDVTLRPKGGVRLDIRRLSEQEARPAEG